MNLALEGLPASQLSPHLDVYGLAVAGVAFLYGARIIFVLTAFGNAVRGYPSLLVSILFLGGVN